MKPLLLAAAVATQTLASSTDVPPGQHILLTAEGQGMQIYRCDHPAGADYKWTFVAPQADLTVHATPVGTHDAGPSWHHVDGSSVQGTVLATSPPTSSSDIPVLLLRARSTAGTGLFSHVSYIRRTETHGGVAPGTGCDADHLNTLARIPYRATYLFYAADVGN